MQTSMEQQPTTSTSTCTPPQHPSKHTNHNAQTKPTKSTAQTTKLNTIHASQQPPNYTQKMMKGNLDNPLTHNTTHPHPQTKPTKPTTQTKPQHHTATKLNIRNTHHPKLPHTTPHKKVKKTAMRLTRNTHPQSPNPRNTTTTSPASQQPPNNTQKTMKGNLDNPLTYNTTHHQP